MTLLTAKADTASSLQTLWWFGLMQCFIAYTVHISHVVFCYSLQLTRELLNPWRDSLPFVCYVTEVGICNWWPQLTVISYYKQPNNISIMAGSKEQCYWQEQFIEANDPQYVLASKNMALLSAIQSTMVSCFWKAWPHFHLGLIPDLSLSCVGPMKHEELCSIYKGNRIFLLTLCLVPLWEHRLHYRRHTIAFCLLTARANVNLNTKRTKISLKPAIKC